MYKICQYLGKKIDFVAHLKRKRGEKLKVEGRILGCGAELGLMVRSGGCWSESGTIRVPSVRTTSHLLQAGFFFVDSIYLSYFSQALKLYCYYLGGIREQRSVQHTN